MACNSAINTLPPGGGYRGGLSTQMTCYSTINTLSERGGDIGEGINANDL